MPSITTQQSERILTAYRAGQRATEIAEAEGVSEATVYQVGRCAGILRGRGWHGNSEGHAAAGRKGGKVHSREHMAEIGRRGGKKVAQDREHMARIGRRGGTAISQNREHMRQIGAVGGRGKVPDETAVS